MICVVIVVVVGVVVVVVVVVVADAVFVAASPLLFINIIHILKEPGLLLSQRQASTDA